MVIYLCSSFGRVRLYSSISRHSKYISQLSRKLSSFKFSNLDIIPTKKPKPKPKDSLLFGQNFTDHMLSIKWNKTDGWNRPLIHELQNISLHPGAKTLHYAVSVFEGMKAMKGKDDVVRLFRPMLNMNRLRESARRCTLPDFDSCELLKCLKHLVKIEKSWVPDGVGTAIYIRPFIIGDDPIIGVDIPSSATLYIVLCPVGSYFSKSFNGVSLYANPEFVRAWPGGCGTHKMSANYGPALYAQVLSKSEGCHAVLWLFGKEEYLTEVGTMNFFMHWINESGEKELLTPPCNGLILPGTTRLSVLELTKSMDLDCVVSEKDVTMSQVLKALEENRILGMFGTGTACVVSPIREIVYKGNRYQIPCDLSNKAMSQRILKALTDIQYAVNGPHPWMVSVED